MSSAMERSTSSALWIWTLMSKGAVAKRYQPYRRLAEEQALRIAELEELIKRAGFVERDGHLVQVTV